VDADGNVYHTVHIGDQVWTVENLKTTRYHDGTPIALVIEASEWEDRLTEAYCWFDNDIGRKDEYGALYNWYAVSTDRLAPPGWRVPQHADWEKLQECLIAAGHNWDETKEENKIAKSLAAKCGWHTDPSPGAIGNDVSKNNRSGFSAVASGSRSHDGVFIDQGRIGTWWSATGTILPSAAYIRFLRYGPDVGLCMSMGNKSWGFSVRLLKE